MNTLEKKLGYLDIKKVGAKFNPSSQQFRTVD